MTEYQFSIGLGEEARHTCLGSLQHAPILNVTKSALPLSSIGFNLQRHVWNQEYADSKFCLVIRGDTPHSHALFNAVKVGCIPVIISDWYPFLLRPFPPHWICGTFCIFLPEGEFLSNPEKSLQNLQDIPLHVIKSNLRNLQVLIMDHPRSPAFVREAMASF